MGFLQTLAASFHARNFRRQSVIVSQPFFVGGQWRMISGDLEGYHTLSFDTRADADRQLRLVGAMAGCGDILYDFIVVDEATAISLDDRPSYLRAIGRNAGLCSSARDIAG
jgi:hypothetical protein